MSIQGIRRYWEGKFAAALGDHTYAKRKDKFQISIHNASSGLASTHLEGYRSRQNAESRELEKLAEYNRF